MDISRLNDDLARKSEGMKRLKRKLPLFFAGAADKMVHANFSAQGFVVKGKVQSRWPL